ncbi:MAG: hypothetical protein ABUR63_00705 [Verrucomicrobiota bacterium]
MRGAVYGFGYTLLRPLEGADSGLFEARHDRIPGICVVRLFPEVGAGSAAALRIESGARLATPLRQAGIARVLDFSVTGQHPVFVAMERVGGRSVEQIIAEDGIFSLRLTVDVVSQVAEALRTAHAAGIVHGALHPGAIRLTESGPGPGRGTVAAKVLGFGWARESRSNDDDPRRVIYCAPEQQQRGAAEQTIDEHADQFALAAIAYEMLAGCAYVSEESSDLADPEARRYRPPPRVAEMVLGLPARLDDVLRKALSYDPRQRFGDVKDFALALRKLADAEDPETATPELVRMVPAGGRGSAGEQSSVEAALTASMAAARMGATSNASPLLAVGPLATLRSGLLAGVPGLGRLRGVSLSARGRRVALIAGAAGAVVIAVGLVAFIGAGRTPVAPPPPVAEVPRTPAPTPPARVEDLPPAAGAGSTDARSAKTVAAKSTRAKATASKARKETRKEARKERKARLRRRARHAAAAAAVHAGGGRVQTR